MIKNKRYPHGGFTLIELLVAVLIIGILAAIALPQYRKSVEKANVAPILSLLKTLYQAQESYYLTNGTYSNDFDSLDIDFPWEATSEYWNLSPYVRDKRENGQWIAEIANMSTVGLYISIGRKSGKYMGTGFQIMLNPIEPRLQKGVLYCAEYVGAKYAFPQGEYCPKIFQTDTSASYPGAVRLHIMSNF